MVALQQQRTLAPAIVVEDLVVAYERHPAVHHLSGSFPAGGLTALVGPNGGGKSTLLKALAGVLPVSSGRLDLDGLRRRDIAYLPQHAEIDRTIPLSVLDLVCVGFLPRAGLFGGIGRAMRAEAQRALQLVGLGGFENRLIDGMSIGQFQRALFARVLVQDARVILLDEPFNALDARTIADLLALLRRWHAEKRTVIAVLHDFEMVRQHFPDAVYLARRLIAWGKIDDVLTPENQLAARQMAESWDEDAALCLPHEHPSSDHGHHHHGHDHKHDHDHTHAA